MYGFITKTTNPCVTQLLSITILNKQFLLKFSFIYPLKQTGPEVFYFMRNESYTFSLLLQISNMLLLLASCIFCSMTLTLSSTIKWSFLAFFFQGDNFSNFSGFIDAFSKNHCYQTKQTIKNRQA